MKYTVWFIIKLLHKYLNNRNEAWQYRWRCRWEVGKSKSVTVCDGGGKGGNSVTRREFNSDIATAPRATHVKPFSLAVACLPATSVGVCVCGFPFVNFKTRSMCVCFIPVHSNELARHTRHTGGRHSGTKSNQRRRRDFFPPRGFSLEH